MLKHEVKALKEQVKCLQQTIELLHVICHTKEYRVTYRDRSGLCDRTELLDQGYSLALLFPAHDNYDKEIWVKKDDNHGRSKR